MKPSKTNVNLPKSNFEFTEQQSKDLYEKIIKKITEKETKKFHRKNVLQTLAICACLISCATALYFSCIK